jgi:dTDP-N-acetylfucosamine:lipid II N-acetylfucosaminyltransferase
MKAFLGTLFSQEECEQKFWAWSHPQQSKKEGVEYYLNSAELISKMQTEQYAVRFVFHGFFDPSVWPKLFFSTLPKRCVWVCWGHDIYQHKVQNRGFKKHGMHVFHALLARRFTHNYALNSGDAELIKKLLWVNNVSVLPYPLIGSNAVREPIKNLNQKVILVGNSASPNNEHIQALNWLKKFSDENVRLVVPLNYAGSKDYVDLVIEHGYRLFGDKFFPITDMLEKSDYDQLLANIDIAVFAHNRQQGLYVVYSALKQGQKMYLRSDTSSFASLQMAGFNISASEKIIAMSYKDFISVNEKSTNKNKDLLLSTYSEEALLPQWQSMIKKFIGL